LLVFPIWALVNAALQGKNLEKPLLDHSWSSAILEIKAEDQKISGGGSPSFRRKYKKILNLEKKDLTNHGGCVLIDIHKSLVTALLTVGVSYSTPATRGMGTAKRKNGEMTCWKH
jgi:hypothetical protein